MSRSDPLLMLADIAQVASERPELDQELIGALYQNLVMMEGRQPTIDEARGYVDRLTSSLDEQTLRRRLGLVTPRKTGPRPPAKPRRGRPKGTRSVPRQQVIDRFRSLRANYGRNPTQRELADNLDPRIEPRTLQEHLADYGLPWPIE